jgi:hypothetical protein
MSNTGKQYLYKSSIGDYTYYIIHIRINGEDMHIYSDKDYNKTLQVWNECQEENWEYEGILRIKEKYRKKHHNPCVERYIYRLPCGDGFFIQRTIGGVTTYFGRYKSLGEAVEDRDLLDRIGWSWENIDMV